jgi:hypothetical protein
MDKRRLFHKKHLFDLIFQTIKIKKEKKEHILTVQEILEKVKKRTE